jgi:hypothetical protein
MLQAVVFRPCAVAMQREWSRTTRPRVRSVDRRDVKADRLEIATGSSRIVGLPGDRRMPSLGAGTRAARRGERQRRRGGKSRVVGVGAEANGRDTS